MSKLQRPKGTQDIISPSIALWQQVEATARDLFNRSGYQEIRTPIFEYTELFSRGVGETTDIVNKEMYTFERSDRSFTLRPEGTAGVVRAFIEQGMSRWPKPVKLYYTGPMFRYERPQEGRQRQFHQLGLEIFGLDTPMADAECVLMALTFFETLGLKNLTLHVNNVGLPEEREQFREGLRAVVKPFLNQLCENCQQRYETNPLRMLDCKVPSCQALFQGESVRDFLQNAAFTEASQKPFSEFLAILTELNVPFTHNPYLVRGLDYYTRTVFEITTDQLGAQNTVCGGGRYNHLVENLGGEHTPAVGWGLGLERLMALLQKQQAQAEPQLDYYLVGDRPAAALQLAATLRAKGHSAEVDLSGKPLGKQLAQASKRNAVFALIPVADSSPTQWEQKNLSTQEQVVFAL